MKQEPDLSPASYMKSYWSFSNEQSPEEEQKKKEREKYIYVYIVILC